MEFPLGSRAEELKAGTQGAQQVRLRTVPAKESAPQQTGQTLYPKKYFLKRSQV